MIRVEKVDESNKLRVLNYLRQNSVKHAFALYHLLHETREGMIYGTFDDKNCLRGYLLIRKTPTTQSIMLEGDEKSGKKLLKHLPDDNMSIITTVEIMSLIKERFPDVRPYRMDWIAVRKGEAHFFTPNIARKLKPSDARQLADLFRTSFMDMPTLRRYLTLKKVKKIQDIASFFLSGFKTGLKWFASRTERSKEWTHRATAYGIFIDNKLVSVMEAKVRLPEVWVIGGGFTHPAYRGRGYATLVLSAIVKEALKSAAFATAFVRSDNESAKRLVKKIGFRKIGERVGVEIGTGFRP